MGKRPDTEGIMARLVPAIHVFRGIEAQSLFDDGSPCSSRPLPPATAISDLVFEAVAWMAGTSPAMTTRA
jgi:hypothetical protein